MATSPGLVAHWRREAEELRHKSREAVDRDDFAKAARLRADADALLAKADAVADKVPSWAGAVA